ncbi:MAG: nucleosidase [Candidatus Nanopelagicales bacterium]|jgi:adenosylhomocysteine nucleosidase
MRLHRSISADRPLLVVALEEEATHLHPLGLPILVTGAGKVNAAVAVATTVGEQRPHSLINLGTAGALRPGFTGSHVVARVTQHDLDDAALFSLTGLHFGEAIDVAASGPTLTTGDAFIADPAARERLAQHADLVDMEAYAIARAAAAARIPVTIVKQVSDEASSEAATSWTESVDECSQHLSAWVRANVAL